jgi:hypothetical protein
MEYIYEAHNMLPKTFCQEMIEKFESDSRRRQGEIQGGAIDHTLKKCTDLNIETITGWGVESKRLNDAFNTAFIDYQNYLKLNIFGEEKAHIVDQLFSGKNVVRNTLTFRKYQVGDYFKWHVDYNHSADRICNFIIYLNDHEACTEFLNGKKIKPEPGKIVFFPTTWVHAHCGQTIEKGDKYMITSFIHYDDTNERYTPLP